MEVVVVVGVIRWYKREVVGEKIIKMSSTTK